MPLSKLTVGDVDAILRGLGAVTLANAILEARTAEGYYRFAPDDPVNGPYSGDLAEARTLEAFVAGRVSADGNG